MSKIRIWMIASPHYPPRFAGGGRFPITLTKGLLKYSELEVAHITSSPGKPVRRVEKKDGYTVYRLPVVPLGGFRWEQYSFAVSSAIYLLVHRKRFDIVHIFGAFPYAWGTLMVAHYLKKRTIVRMTEAKSDDCLSIRNRALGRFQLRLLALADKVVSISDELTMSYAAAGLPLAKLVEITNGVDHLRFKPVGTPEKRGLRSRLGLEVERDIVAFVGSIIHRKGPDVLVEVWHKLKQDNDLALPLLLLVGPTDVPAVSDQKRFLGSLVRRIRELGLERDVRLYGRSEEVEGVLQASDVFAFLSRSEGMPSALLEAMACGLPSVASVQSGACRFIEDGKSGFIVDCEDADSAARHLKVLLTSEERRSRMGVAARERILSGATLDRCAAEHRALYIELLEGTP